MTTGQQHDDKSCTVEGCDRKHYGKGFCSKHYASNRRANNTRQCSVEGCIRSYVSSGYCGAHYRRMLKRGEVGDAQVQRREANRTCSVTGCGLPHDTGGLCTAHHGRQRRGAPLDPPIKKYGVYTECRRQPCYKAPIANGYCPAHESRRNKYFTVYGITYEEFDTLFDLQNGVCFLCEAPLVRDDRLTHLDHDHDTDRARGILCMKCNVGIGMFQDDVDLIKEVVRYLESTEDLRDRL
jgi:hypothetical protein